jgi:creatinine amidohydrolase
MLVEEMTWEEYRDGVGHKILILPVGSIEQHGPHLPLNTDVVIPKGLAMMVAEAVGAMVLPPILYGYKSHPASGGGPSFPGTTSLDGSTLTHLALDILRDTCRHGGKKLMVMNGHYENVAFVAEAIDLLLREVKDSVRVLLVNWWELVSDEMLDELFAEAGFPGWEMEHAALTETSLVQYFAPELVREDRIVDDQSERIPKYSIFPPPDDIVPSSGTLYKATYASREKGEKLARHVTDFIVDIAREEFGRQ